MVEFTSSSGGQSFSSTWLALRSLANSDMALLHRLLLLISVVATAASACSAPTALSFDSSSETTLTVSWSGADAGATFTLESNVDGMVTHSGLTDPTFQYTGLTAGAVIDMTARVDADCSGTAAAPFIDTLTVNTMPAAPTVVKNMDEGRDINLGMTQETGSVDFYRVTVGGDTSSVYSHSFYKSGLSGTTQISVSAVLGDIEGPATELEHVAPKAEKVMGLDPWTFAWIMIALIILFVLLVVIIIVIVYICIQRARNRRQREARERQARADRKARGYDSDENSNPSEDQAWEYRDPYETADYRVTNTQKKRAFAIAANRAAMTNKTEY